MNYHCIFDIDEMVNVPTTEGRRGTIYVISFTENKSELYPCTNAQRNRLSFESSSHNEEATEESSIEEAQNPLVSDSIQVEIEPDSELISNSSQPKNTRPKVNVSRKTIAEEQAQQQDAKRKEEQKEQCDHNAQSKRKRTRQSKKETTTSKVRFSSNTTNI